MILRTFADLHGISPHMNSRRLWTRIKNHAWPLLPIMIVFCVGAYLFVTGLKQ